MQNCFHYDHDYYVQLDLIVQQGRGEDRQGKEEREEKGNENRREKKTR